MIAILVILAAILFPMLKKANEAGRKVVCMSHLRQVGQAAILYKDDWDARYVLGAVRQPGDTWRTSWHDLLAPPLSPQCLYCPMTPNAGYRTSYGINRWVSGFGASAGEWEIGNPTGTWYVTEKNNGDWPAFLPEERNAPFYKPLDPRHSNRAWALYLDGHVKLEREMDIGK